MYILLLSGNCKMSVIRSIKLKFESLITTNKKYTLSFILIIIFLQQFNTFLVNSIKDSTNDVNDSSDKIEPDKIVEISNKNPNLDYDCQCKQLEMLRRNNSVCSEYTNARDSNQKIISYSYYEGQNDEAKYLESNAETINHLYPGYIMRIYHNFTENQKLCELFCQNEHIDLCNVRKLGNSIEGSR